MSDKARNLLTRRGFLAGSVLAGAGAVVPRAEASIETLGGGTPVSAALHVHGSGSEGQGSWDLHGKRADDAAVDVIFATDHDERWMHLDSPTTSTWAPNQTLTHPQKMHRVNLSRLVLTVDGAADTVLHLLSSNQVARMTPTVTFRGSGTWRPVEDLRALVPSAIADDWSLIELSYTGSQPTVTFNWGIHPDNALGIYTTIIAAADGRHAVSIYPAMEMSGHTPHVNVFGGRLAFADYSALPKQGGQAMTEIVRQAHATGAIASFNHAFGVDAMSTPSVATALQRLIQTQACGADLLEVAYVTRNGVGLPEYTRLWDGASSAKLFMHGTGVSDDHAASPWLGQDNRFCTVVWANNRSEGAMVDGLRRGRIFSRKLGDWNGTLDMTLNGAPMGSVSPSASSRIAHVLVTSPPRNATVQFRVGRFGSGGTTVVKSWQPAGLLDAWVNVPADSFVRFEVLNAAREVVGLSNAIWSPR